MSRLRGPLMPGVRPLRLKIIPNPQAHGEDSPVYGRRLARDGWVLKQEGSYPYINRGWETERSEIWDKTNKMNGITLVMELVEINFEKLGGPYIEQFAIVKEGTTIPIGQADWADWDQGNRLVVAREGKLFEGRIDKDGLEWRELADFNSNKPEPKEAPKEAKRW